MLDVPLAFADARTLQPSTDLVQSRLMYPSEGEGAQPEGETLNVKWNPAHRWYYLSEMGPDEGEPSCPSIFPSLRTPRGKY